MKNVLNMRNILMVIFLLTVVFISACKGTAASERSEILMGTVVTLKAKNGDAQAAVDESFARIAELEKNISADLAKIEAKSASGEFVKISPDVYKILETAQKYSELTDGAFDVTIGAVVELWGIGTDNARIPSAEEIATVKNFVGYRHLILKDGSAYLDKRGVKIDLGGTAKGYGSDLVREIFAEHGVSDGLIDFGTSTIFAVGRKKIGIRNSRAAGISEIIELENCAVSTSGDYEKFFIVEGQRYHHIIDPGTCAPAENENSSVSVVVKGNIKNCGMVADILSTTAFVMGKRFSKLKMDGITVNYSESK